jgi:hypothetical protein
MRCRCVNQPVLHQHLESLSSLSHGLLAIHSVARRVPIRIDQSRIVEPFA